MMLWPFHYVGLCEDQADSKARKQSYPACGVLMCPLSHGNEHDNLSVKFIWLWHEGVHSCVDGSYSPRPYKTCWSLDRCASARQQWTTSFPDTSAVGSPSLLTNTRRLCSTCCHMSLCFLFSTKCTGNSLLTSIVIWLDIPMHLKAFLHSYIISSSCLYKLVIYLHLFLLNFII